MDDARAKSRYLVSGHHPGDGGTNRRGKRRRHDPSRVSLSYALCRYSHDACGALSGL